MKKCAMVILILAILSTTGVAYAGNKTGPFIGGSPGYPVLCECQSLIHSYE